MQLQQIDKTLYQYRYKRVAIGLAASLAILSLSFSTILIALFGCSEDGSNTALNGAGLALAVVVLISALQKLRYRPYFKEVAYVWTLKQELNQITRRMHKIKAAAEQGNRNAMVILNFSYAGSEQLWDLDDNTLVMEELRLWRAELEQQQQRFQVEVALEDYQRELLKDF
ncbi:MAG: DUF3087 family protein [Cellvibrionaceae bacterium]